MRICSCFSLGAQTGGYPCGFPKLPKPKDGCRRGEEKSGEAMRRALDEVLHSQRLSGEQNGRQARDSETGGPGGAPLAGFWLNGVDWLHSPVPKKTQAARRRLSQLSVSPISSKSIRAAFRDSPFQCSSELFSGFGFQPLNAVLFGRFSSKNWIIPTAISGPAFGRLDLGLWV